MYNNPPTFFYPVMAMFDLTMLTILSVLIIWLIIASLKLRSDRRNITRKTNMMDLIRMFDEGLNGQLSSHDFIVIIQAKQSELDNKCNKVFGVLQAMIVIAIIAIAEDAINLTIGFDSFVAATRISGVEKLALEGITGVLLIISHCRIKSKRFKLFKEKAEDLLKTQINSKGNNNSEGTP